MDNETYRKTGGPAFPSEQHETNDNNWNQTFEPGMTLRDYFAAKAMQVYVVQEGITDEKVARWAYDTADAMLRAREQ